MKQKLAKLKAAEMKKKQEEDELIECTFHPKIIYKERFIPDNDDYFY